MGAGLQPPTAFFLFFLARFIDSTGHSVFMGDNDPIYPKQETPKGKLVDIDDIVGGPGTLSHVARMPLTQIFKSGLIRTESKFVKGFMRTEEIALSLHLTDKERESGIWTEETWSFKDNTLHPIGVVFRNELKDFIRGGLEPEFVKELYDMGSCISAEVCWSSSNWRKVRRKITSKGINLPKRVLVKEYHPNRQKKVEGKVRVLKRDEREKVLGEYIYTLYKIDNPEDISDIFGIRAYCMDRKKVIRPIESIPPKFICAIISYKYTKKDFEIMSKYRKNVKFYHYPDFGDELVLMSG